jgi:hypothetical protein
MSYVCIVIRMRRSNEIIFILWFHMYAELLFSVRFFFFFFLNNE